MIEYYLIQIGVLSFKTTILFGQLILCLLTFLQIPFELGLVPDQVLDLSHPFGQFNLGAGVRADAHFNGLVLLS